MAAGTTRRTAVTHGHWGPGCTRRVAGATGIKGHGRNLVRLDAGERPSGCIPAIMAGCTIGVCQHILVREL